MDFSTILTYMYTEIALVGVIIAALLYDLIAGARGRKYFHGVICTLMLLFIAGTVWPYQQENASIFGGMFVYAPIYSIVKSVLAIGTLLVFLLSDSWLRKPDTEFKRGEFYVLTLSTLLGMDFMVSAKYKHNSAEAGAKYILSALFASGLMLYGISFFYGTTGTLYFEDMVPMINGSALQILAMVFFFTGLGFKISLVPFHLWTADTYEGAPTPVTSYLSVVSKAAAAFALMVVLIKVFAPMVEYWQTLLYIVIVLSITVANLFAIRQKNLKRFLAFSSISQAGYIMLAVISGTPYGMTSLVYYVLVYMVANLAAFGVITAVEQNSDGKVNMEDYNGLYKTNPKLAIVMMLAIFSLAGIPPFAGFFSKFFIFAAAFEQGFHVLVFIALLNTIISLYYYMLVVKAMFITPNDSPILAGILILGLASSVFDGINLYAFGM